MPIFYFQTLKKKFCLPTTANVNIQATFEAFRDFVGIEINCLQPLGTVFSLFLQIIQKRTLRDEQQPVGPVTPSPTPPSQLLSPVF